MNFGDPNFLIAVLRLLLFLWNEFPVAELAFHGYVRTLLEGRSKCGKIAPRYKSTLFQQSRIRTQKAPDTIRRHDSKL